MISAKKDYLKRVLCRRSFTGLMDLYEHNYRLLMELVPDLERLPERVVSRVSESKDLYLEIQEKCKFTTTIRLTYYFDDPEFGIKAEPDLFVRIYHDARQAEAMACRLDGFMAHENQPNEKQAYLDCRWESNLFVEKWMQYSINQGHLFTLQNTEAVEEDPEEAMVEMTE